MEARRTVVFTLCLYSWLNYCSCIILPEAVNVIPRHEPKVVHKWVTLKYDIPENMTYHNFRMTYPYDYRNTILGGVKVYKDELYINIPRIARGVSATLNRLIEKEGETLLEAFPDWSWQTIGDCDALQAVNSIEIDPEKGWMWIIDTGRVNTFWGGVRNLCQAKLIIYDLNEGREVTRYIFPPEVASITDAYLSDIVIDPEAGFAFIPNTVEGKLIFFSLNDNFSIGLDHPMFKFEKGNQSITVEHRKIILANVSANIYGVAMSPRRDYILFSHLGGHGVYRISTEFFRKLVKNPDHVSELGNYIKRVGYKLTQSQGLLMGHNALYYGSLGRQAVYSWPVKDLLSSTDLKQDILDHMPQTEFAADDRMYWINTITLDNNGVMWITSSNLVRYFLDVMDYHDTYNYFIWKVYVGESSYLKKKSSALEIPKVEVYHIPQPKLAVDNSNNAFTDESNNNFTDNSNNVFVTDDKNMASMTKLSSVLMILNLTRVFASLLQS